MKTILNITKHKIKSFCRENFNSIKRRKGFLTLIHRSKEKLMEVFLVQLHCPPPLHPAPDNQHPLISLLQLFLCLISTCTYCYRPGTVPLSPYHMSSATELIHLVAAPLLLFLSACTPDASGYLPPPPQLSFPKTNPAELKHCGEAHLCQGTCTCQ